MAKGLYSSFRMGWFGACLLTALLLCPLWADTATAAKARHVLILHSYHSGMVWVDNLEKSIREELLLPPFEDLVIHTEYMDSKRNLGQPYLDRLVRIYHDKYTGLDLELILATDNNALDFLVRHREELFGNAPIVFGGVNNFTEDMIAGVPDITGVTEVISFEDTVEAILKQFPKTKEIFVINDYLKTGRTWQAEIARKQRAYEGRVQFTHNKNLTVDEFQDRMRSIKPGTVILLGVYFADRAGHYLTYEKLGQLITKNASVPVYTLVRFNARDEAIGGKVVSGHVHGREMARLGRQVLEGKPAGDIPVVKGGGNTFVFNWPGMKKFGLSRKDLPPGSVIINEPFSFYREYSQLVWTGTFIIFVLSLLVFLLSRTVFTLRRTRQALLFSERKHRLIIENSQEGFGIIQDNQFVFTNPKMQEVLGYTAEELNEMDLADLFEPGDREKAILRRKRLIRGEPISPHEQYGITTRSGERRYILVSAHRVDWDGVASGLLTVSDVTELRQSEENFSAIVSTASEAIGIFQDGRMVYCNPALISMFGYSLGELVGRPSLDFVHPDDREEVSRWYADRRSEGEEHGQLDYRVLAKNGRIVWVMLSAKTMEWKGQIATLVVLTNITDRKRAEEAARKANEMLEVKVEERTRDLKRLNEQLLVLNEQKSAFVSSASHELRTPLTSILGFAILVKKTVRKHFLPLVQADPALEAKAASVLENLEIINKEGDRLTRLLNDMLDLSKIESGKMDWRDEQLSIRSVMDIVTAGARVKLQDKPEVAFSVSIESEDHILLADQDRIIQVFSNLLDNAIKFTQQGTVSLTTRATEEGMLEVRVTDTGTGMTSKERSLVFHKYYQAESSQKGIPKAPKGTGLGLAICKEIIDHYGGRINVEAGPDGKGSSFYVLLPLT